MITKIINQELDRRHRDYLLNAGCDPCKCGGTAIYTPAFPGFPSVPGTGAGANGKSAYELAVANGFTGTVTEWLLSLKGAPGTGSPGNDGKSAYQLAQANGFTGTVTEWLASLKGEPGTNTTGGGGTPSTTNYLTRYRQLRGTI
jgi:hypothetical protein